MKSFLKYCLFLILFCSYAAASLELDEKENKQNYGKETHDFILSEKHSDFSSSVDSKKQVEINEFYTPSPAHRFFYHPGLYHFAFAHKFYSPPRLNKIYLYNSVFLI